MAAERAGIVADLGRSDAAEIAKLRTADIPRRVGMAAAARLLAEDVARFSLQQIEARRADGTLARVIEASEKTSGDTVEVLAGILRDQVALTVGRIRARGERWLDDSLRLEGQALALQGRLARLAEVSARSNGKRAEEAEGAPVAESEAEG